jgi:hypothetical protein
MKKSPLFPIALISAALFANCAGQPELDVCPANSGTSSTKTQSEKIGQVSSALVNGSADPGDTYSATACVGGGYDLVNGDTGPCATGTLITPDLILTAKHLGAFVGTWRAVLFGPDARVNPLEKAKAIKCWEFRDSGIAECCDHVDPSAGDAYATYLATCPKPLATNEHVISDLAVWQLDHSITDITPIPVALQTPKGTNSLDDLMSTVAVAVGYGYTTKGCDNSNPASKSGTRHYGAVRIDYTQYYDGATLSGPNSTSYYSGNTMIMATYDTSWAYTAPGDSGGPLLVDYGGSKGPGGCVPVSNLKVVGTAYRGCNYAFSATVASDVSRALKGLLDQDAANLAAGSK